VLDLFLAGSVPEVLLLQAVEMATWSLYGNNEQNWHFYIILNKDILKTISDACRRVRECMDSWTEVPHVVRLPLAGMRALDIAPAMK
jgi:hypothetical protein